ncbi:glycosyltransferase [Bacillus sp. LBG-1-113]|uniref:glycosyltransferase n=1 Tax=Bacillus sp. LBG-1-113 TaxID=2886094 RepID=UPI001E3EBA58|nr:glycosyltransferase [Bacillus sp. LBG-1-113]MCC2931126.1 glycosyltransferase [Bacillus sp. LBG-1-113]
MDLKMNVRLPEAQYIFTTSSVRETFGGLTEAMLQRGRLFSEYAGQPTKVVSFNYDPNYKHIISSLKQREKINDDISIINIYEYFKGDEEEKLPAIKHPIEEDGLKHHKDPEKNAYRYYKNGLYVHYKRFADDGNLILADYFNENRKRTKREEYTQDGYVHRVTYMDLEYNKPRQELFLRNDGTCYMSKWLTMTKDKKSVKVERVNLFDRNGDFLAVFSSNMELQHYFLDQIIEEKRTFLIGEERGTDPITMAYKNPHIYKVFLTHNIHVRAPHHYDSVLRLGNRPVMENMSHPDAVIFLTEKQKTDIVKRFGDRSNYFVIPHAHKKPDTLADFSERDLKRVVMLARYHEQKNLSHAIKAFQITAKQVPDARLEIYGFGELEKELQKLIEELNLHQNVFLKGFTENPKAEFKTAAFSALSSDYEGFGLVVLESLANGCPVVSYDLKYGPSDMINDGENGFLVEDKNIKQLGQKMAELLQQPELIKAMSENAYKSADKFSEQAFMQRWRDMFYKVIENKPLRNNLSNMEFHLTDYDWEDKNQFQVKGFASFTGQVPPESLQHYHVYFKVYNRDTKEFDVVAATAERDHDNRLLVTGMFHLENLVSTSGVLDVSLGIEWDNSYFEKRIGYSKDNLKKLTAHKVKGFHVQPYFTETYHNLSFRVKQPAGLAIFKR